MERQTKYTLFAFLILALSLASMNCQAQQSRDNELVERVSNYTGQDYDTLMKYLRFTDSSFVKSVGLRFYYYYDKRDIVNWKYWGASMVIFNNYTHNAYLYSRPIEGRQTKGGPHYFESNVGIYPFFADYYCPDVTSQNFMKPYYLKNLGLSMKLSEILNDIPLPQKTLLTRKVIDSIFGNIIYYQSNPENKSANRERFIHDSLSISGLLLNSRTSDKYYKENERNIKKIEKLLYKKVTDSSYYIYFYTSLLFNGTFCVFITINEDIKQQSLYGDSAFYKRFDNEPMLYNVKVYSVYYFY